MRRYSDRASPDESWAISGNGKAADPFPDLTPRERQLLDLMATGLSTAVISTRLGLSPKTITNHTSAIYAKLQFTGRAVK